ncbi:hypothetical protein C7271_01035 [filamentous cyanobacterium CCP5]|nr:hypothetical protein C7271_01035 [filamentous cyanobacterium CCP5]
MPTPEEFLEVTKWAAGGTLALGAITILAFVLGWGIRFRLVGATSFAAVLTGGLLGLSFQPFTRTVIPGAVSYATVYDSGASQVVIAVPTEITPDQLDATLRQAASNLFKPYRLGLPGETTTIRARAIVHRPGGVSDLVYLGQVQPNGESENPLTVTLYPDQIAQLSAANDA